MGSSDVSGEVSGNTIRWKQQMTVPMPMTLDCEATAEGDTLTGTVGAGAFGTIAVFQPLVVAEELVGLDLTRELTTDELSRTYKNKTHPFQKKFSTNSDAIFLHAETDAIYNATRKYETSVIAKSKLYISRVKYFDSDKKYFVQGLSKPCAGCQRAIANFNIKHVCFTKDTEGFDYLWIYFFLINDILLKSMKD